MNSLKDKGNEAYSKNDFFTAINYYTEVINTLVDIDKPLSEQTVEELDIMKKLIANNDCLLSCFNNRSQCFLNCRQFCEAIDDADKGIFISLH